VTDDGFYKPKHVAQNMAINTAVIDCLCRQISSFRTDAVSLFLIRFQYCILSTHTVPRHHQHNSKVHCLSNNKPYYIHHAQSFNRSSKLHSWPTDFPSFLVPDGLLSRSLQFATDICPQPDALHVGNSHFPSFTHISNVWREVQIMRFHIM
jgi:hypothetical protein